ncbi:hypothetical protein [Stenotrophomonas sp. GZD-301]|uniref:hypothetical protein n=1 Tax=Stenotrophomonas sp. GZD-301 TaxID=3404814 RepID=UPI003BB6040D
MTRPAAEALPTSAAPMWWDGGERAITAREKARIEEHSPSCFTIALVPATPATKWAAAGRPDPHGNRYNCLRAALTLGHLTDDELANAVFMHGNEQPTMADLAAGTALPGITYLTAAKDRIRWLSRALSAAISEQQAGDGKWGARAQFEAWAKDRDMQVHRRDVPGLQRNGQYGNLYTEDAWQAWQAALAARQPGAQEPSQSWTTFQTLEVGRTYQLRSGGEIQITAHSGNPNKPFKSSHGSNYRSDGRYYGSDDSCLDLVKVRMGESLAQGIDLAPRPMDTAPRDGTLVRLLVDFDENAIEDSIGATWTIGACNDDNVSEGARIGWQFAGWCWTHDHFTQGTGAPVGWLPLIDSQRVAAPGAQEPVGFWIALDPAGAIHHGQQVFGGDSDSARKAVQESVGEDFVAGEPVRMMQVYAAPPAHGIDLGQQQDAARWRWVREQSGVTVSVEEADDDGDLAFVSGHTPAELDAAIDSLRDAAPEVGGAGQAANRSSPMKAQVMQVGEVVEDDRFPGGLADAVACVNELEELAEALHQKVFGHESDGESGASTVLQMTLRQLNEKHEQVGEVQGDARAQFEAWLKENSYNRDKLSSGRYVGDGVQIAWEAVQALAARQPAAQEVAVWVSPEQLEAHADPQRGEGGHYLPARKSSAGKFTQPLYRATPAQGIDLGPLVAELAAADSEYAEAKKRYHTVSAMSGAAGGRASCRTAYERELTAKSRLDAAVRTLIDQRDAAPGVGNG